MAAVQFLDELNRCIGNGEGAASFKFDGKTIGEVRLLLDNREDVGRYALVVLVEVVALDGDGHGVLGCVVNRGFHCCTNAHLIILQFVQIESLVWRNRDVEL